MLQKSFQRGRQFWLLRQTDKPLNFPPPLEEDHRRNSADAIFRRGSGIVVRVYLADANPAGEIVRQFLDGRGDHFARPAPRSPEVHQHRVLAAQYFRLKIGVREFQHLPGHVMPLCSQTANPRALVFANRGGTRGSNSMANYRDRAISVNSDAVQAGGLAFLVQSASACFCPHLDARSIRRQSMSAGSLELIEGGSAPIREVWLRKDES